MTTIACNNFLKRQTIDSPFSCFLGTWDELEQLALAHFETRRPVIQDGKPRADQVLVSVPPDGFFAGTVEVTSNTPLIATFVQRRLDERPYIQIEAKGEKAAARTVELVLYRHDVLAAENSASTDADWEIISINADASGLGKQPLHPVAMARNFLHLPGGTPAVYSAEEFAIAIDYWNRYANVREETPKHRVHRELTAKLGRKPTLGELSDALRAAGVPV